MADYPKPMQQFFDRNSGIRSKIAFIQLIPLTPKTSFRMTSGGGSVQERALMFAILRQEMR